jgi:hypothetical protein
MPGGLPRNETASPSEYRNQHKEAVVHITKLIPALAVPLLAVACSESPTGTVADDAPLFAESGNQGGNPTWAEFTVDVDWTYYSACLQEDLHGTGQSLVRRHTVTTAGETRLTMHVTMVEGTWQLEGMTSGDIWLPVPGNHTISMRTDPRTFAALTEHFVFENQTTGQILDWSSTIHYVTNANGEVKVDFMKWEDNCHARGT